MLWLLEPASLCTCDRSICNSPVIENVEFLVVCTASLYLLQMENTVGSRFGIHPSIKTERYRGSSQIKFESTDPETKKPWKTTNQAFGECTEVKATTGLCNQGICSDVAKRVHKKIGIYGS